MKRRYHKAKFVLFLCLWTFLFGFGFVCCFFFYSRERKKSYRQLHYLQMDNLKLGTYFCTAQCLQTESIHGLSAARIKAGWASVCIYCPLQQSLGASPAEAASQRQSQHRAAAAEEQSGTTAQSSAQDRNWWNCNSAWSWEQQPCCFISPAETWEHCWSGCTVISTSQ